jgi:hypothetical protein
MGNKKASVASSNDADDPSLDVVLVSSEKLNEEEWLEANEGGRIAHLLRRKVIDCIKKDMHQKRAMSTKKGKLD